MPIVTTVRPSCLDSTTRVRADNHACGSVAEATLLSCHARRAEPAAGDTHEAQVTAQQGGTRCKGVTPARFDEPSHRRGPRRPILTHGVTAVSYTHLRAHETRHDLVCRLLLEKKKN